MYPHTKNFRLLRAKRVAQEMRTLEREGVLYLSNPSSCVTRDEYMEKFRADLTRRINNCPASKNYTPCKNHHKVNAERAADIVRNGEKSRWWQARSSRHHAGSDTRGIIHSVHKYRKRIKETRRG